MKDIILQYQMKDIILFIYIYIIVLEKYLFTCNKIHSRIIAMFDAIKIYKAEIYT